MFSVYIYIYSICVCALYLWDLFFGLVKLQVNAFLKKNRRTKIACPASHPSRSTNSPAPTHQTCFAWQKHVVS